MRQAAAELGWESVDAILLDLGLSSLQLDDPDRGFSFRYDAPLGMRFDADSGGETAHELINSVPAEELADLLYRFGEERHSRRIARAIVENRPISTTRELADLVASAIPKPAKTDQQNSPGDPGFPGLAHRCQSRA